MSVNQRRGECWCCSYNGLLYSNQKDRALHNDMVNLTDMLFSERSQIYKYIFYDSIYMKFKNGQNWGAWGTQSVEHLPSAQVMIPGFWDRAPCQAPCTLGRKSCDSPALLSSLPPSFPLSAPPCFLVFLLPTSY